MKYISVVLMLLFSFACQTPTKKGKFTWQDDTSTQERTVASSETAPPGSFIHINARFPNYGIEIMNRLCDSRRFFYISVEYHRIVCVKK